MLRGRTALAALVVAAASVGVSACGGDSQPDPSIPRESAVTLLGTLDEIEANVDNGSCLVAAGKVQELQDELDELPSDVNADLIEALERASVNLNDLVNDPDQCEPPPEPTTTTEPEPTTTVEPTTTEEPTTTQQTQTQTQPSPTQTQPAQPPGGSGGLDPGGQGGL